MSRDDNLFAKNDSYSAFRAQEARMLSEIDAAPEEHVLEVDEDEGVEALGERYRVDVPSLHADQKYMDRLRRPRSSLARLCMRTPLNLDETSRSVVG